MMIDLKNTTFIIPVRIESQDRYRNLHLSLLYLTTHLDTNIIVCESDVTRLVPDVLEQIPNNSQIKYLHHFTNDKLFHRTKLLNEMLVESKTDIVVNYDCDVVLPLNSYIKAVELCAVEYDLMYPFSFGDNAQCKVALDQQSIENFKNNFDLEALPGVMGRAEYGFCQFFKRQSYIDGFMENENFMAYGPEDYERAYRWHKLGYKVGRINGMVYHFEHSRTPNSSTDNPFMKTNDNLFDKLKAMGREETEEYYQTQQYYQHYQSLNG